MDTNRAAALKTTLPLVLLCVAVTIGGIGWQAWDMFGPGRRSMLQGWDDSFYYFWLPSVVIDRDLDFSNQLAQSESLPAADREAALAAPRTATGLVPNKYPPGWAIGSAPFFLLVHAFSPAGSTGFEPRYLVAVWLGQLLYAIGGMWLATRILQRFFPPRESSFAALVIWLASPLVYYQSARLSMSHSQVFALAMLVFWTALRLEDGERRSRFWALLGFASALLVVTRNVTVVYLLMPAWVVLRQLRSARAAAALIAGAAPIVALQLLAWKVLYGRWLVYSYGGERFDFSQLHLAEVLFSPRHGWFYWHPLLLPAVAGFAIWAIARGGAIGRAWLVSLLLMIGLAAAWPMWWLGSSFGYRGFEVGVFLAMMGWAALRQQLGRHARARVVIGSVAAAAIVWNLALLSLFLAQRIPREEAVRYRDAAAALGELVRPAP
ncbi:MAG TPA: hypothetical protein VNR00_00345 [Opitutus sp.]|nr:hypothetical protein [Opitutus sp.]